MRCCLQCVPVPSDIEPNSLTRGSQGILLRIKGPNGNLASPCCKAAIAARDYRSLNHFLFSSRGNIRR
ncbi:hypothetical protein BDP55DRAFT_362730 [Colletotrichum godetiae]|uniref:Uncharacterized protein n=1 Tax=Colletotrichum godetiae TaxID=1209918 RepID=A0AAJ0EQ83_9PEZI|nr:uncharacterized protein BDP55DRAFT_362730 [Colletotrichum godetiae]KAK1659327.1 hypothetical protein BDP55DRAFT_362730 [Colletotrichum godetiae]